MLKDQIKKDLDNSLRSGDQLKRLVLGMLANAIQNRELSKRTQLSKTISSIPELEAKSRLADDEIIEVIAGEIKKRKESVEQFKNGGRMELAQKEAKEMEILKAYMPAQMIDAEVEKEVQFAIEESGAKDIKDMGRVIGLLMAKLKGKADGGLVSRLVKEKLSK